VRKEARAKTEEEARVAGKYPNSRQKLLTMWELLLKPRQRPKKKQGSLLKQRQRVAEAEARTKAEGDTRLAAEAEAKTKTEELEWVAAKTEAKATAEEQARTAAEAEETSEPLKKHGLLQKLLWR
jgi:hypothetical protein